MSDGGDSRELIRRVAHKLGPLTDRVVFPGGSVTGLLVTDPCAAPPRPTCDVDVTVDVASHADYAKLNAELRARGFAEDAQAGAPICRWAAGDLRVDVMPTDVSILGFTNRWYGWAASTRVRHRLPDGTRIWLVTAPCFLATKLEAFRGRGNADYPASHDLEDLIAVVDGRTTIEAFTDALPGHLPGDAASQARLPALFGRMIRLAKL